MNVNTGTGIREAGREINLTGKNSCLYTLQANLSAISIYIYLFIFLISKEIISNASEKKLSKLINPRPQV